MTDRHLVRVRWGVRGALALGVAASVAANMLHADPNPISQAISAWPPLALLLTVELISRVPVHRRSLAVVRLSATALIAGIAAWVSYTHMVAVAARYGEHGLASHLIPLSVDGVVVVASVCLVELAGRMRPHAAPVDAAPAPTPDADSKPQAVPEAAPDVAPDTASNAALHSPRKRPARKPSTRKPLPTPDTGTAVRRMRERHPDMSTADIARRVGVTDRTVRRHLNAPKANAHTKETTR
ncbi:helix-turn-helix domain-containing protein [Asanoa siamensis]|uniref:DUF2637 domain-containing protein n=1 Tax=Asanoa siamensis TaxID=926357 RepID=A0ABQ4D3M3_9ACTN|nr:DUF2637 domain-containing protein [Asanoa siamensis]GIF78135.1 hypothetical protein Asi02nite_76530 [Asanoa siamensis]